MLKGKLFKSHAPVFLLLGALTVLSYAPIRNLKFIKDDKNIVRMITRPGGGTDWGEILNDFHSPLFQALGVYRPLYSLSFGIDHWLYGSGPFGYHVTNVFLHLICSILVYLVAFELTPGERKRQIAATAGAIFALHPLHAEPVTWIAGRVDVICGVFYLSALLFFVRWLRADRGLYLALALALFTLALMSKETAAALPGVLLLVAIYEGKRAVHAALRVAPFAALLGIFLVLRQYFLSTASGYADKWPDLKIVVVKGFVFRTLHSFFPLNLYYLPEGLFRVVMGTLHSWLTTLLVIVLVAYLLFKIRDRLVILLVGAYLVSLAPVFAALFPAPMLVSSRWLYIPSAFLCLFVAYFLWMVVPRYVRWRPAPLAATGLVCLMFFAVLAANNAVWLEHGHPSQLKKQSDRAR